MDDTTTLTVQAIAKLSFFKKYEVFRTTRLKKNVCDQHVAPLLESVRAALQRAVTLVVEGPVTYDFTLLEDP